MSGDSRQVAVALLHPCFWPEVRRGTERIIRGLADGLLALGHRPRLITSHPGLPTRTVEDGLPIMRHWRPPDGRLRARLYPMYLTHVPFSYLSLALGHDDLAHALYPTDALAALRWSNRTGRPTVFTAPGMARPESLTHWRRWLEIVDRAVSESSAVVAHSRAAAESVREWLGVECRVIHPPIDLASFPPGRERTDVPTIFCAAAVEDPRKRVGMLVDAFRAVRRRRPDARLMLVRPTDPETARSLTDAGDGVELVDTMGDQAALVRAYGESWLTVLPARDEALGLVLVESLACGTPVVGSNSGGIPEVVNEQVGRLFDGDDPDVLANALLDALELAGEPDIRSVCRARAELFSTDRCARAYARLYRDLLD